MDEFARGVERVEADIHNGVVERCGSVERDFEIVVGEAAHWNTGAGVFKQNGTDGADETFGKAGKFSVGNAEHLASAQMLDLRRNRVCYLESLSAGAFAVGEDVEARDIE